MKMNFNLLKSSLIAAAIFVGLGTALASVGEDGTGFVGKGDVQRALGWNNRQLQDNAESVQFRVESTAETTWQCRNEHNQNVQERNTTTTIGRVLTNTLRERNQVTGFFLEGYDDDYPIETTTSGPQSESCPQGQNWGFVAGSLETGPATQRVYVRAGENASWVLL